MACDLRALANLDGSDPEQVAALLRECTAVLEDPSLWLWTIALTVVGAAVGALIGRYKNAVVRDAILGAALGPIGWIISLCLPTPKPPPTCPACARTVAAGDRHCRHCGARLDA
jgi:hypothetical protein